MSFSVFTIKENSERLAKIESFKAADISILIQFLQTIITVWYIKEKASL